jgi:hypothetical protein
VMDRGWGLQIYGGRWVSEPCRREKETKEKREKLKAREKIFRAILGNNYCEKSMFFRKGKRVIDTAGTKAIEEGDGVESKEMVRESSRYGTIQSRTSGMEELNHAPSHGRRGRGEKKRKKRALSEKKKGGRQRRLWIHVGSWGFIRVSV